MFPLSSLKSCKHVPSCLYACLPVGTCFCPACDCHSAKQQLTSNNGTLKRLTTASAADEASSLCHVVSMLSTVTALGSCCCVNPTSADLGTLASCEGLCLSALACVVSIARPSSPTCHCVCAACAASHLSPSQQSCLILPPAFLPNQLTD